MRIRLAKQPKWNESFRGWAAKFIKKNMWRCDQLDEFSDHMNDAYITFRHVLASYPTINEPKHIMSLFQISMINNYHNRSIYNKRKTQAEISIETILGEDLKIIDTLGENNNNGYLNILLSQLPEKIKIAINALQSFDELDYLQARSVITDKAEFFTSGKNLTNSALSRIIGLPKGTNLIEAVYSAILCSEDEMSESVSNIEREIISVTNFVPEKRYRKRQTYLEALVRAIDRLDDARFAELTQEAAEWSETATQAFVAGKEIPDFEVQDHSSSNGNAQTPLNEVKETVKNELDSIEVGPPIVQDDNQYENHLDVADEIIHEVEPVKKERKPRKARVAKSTVKVITPRVPRPDMGNNKWGVALGTKADVVCQLISRPDGATMKEIEEVTGHTQYNVCNRLQRKGFNIKKEGLVIKLLD